MDAELVERLVASANEIGLEIGVVENFVLGNVRDTIFDADITPNRPDAMNHRGFARDLAAALELPFEQGRISLSVPERGAPVEKIARVSIEAPEQCHRFAARLIRGASSPGSAQKWTRRMNAVGLKPIDAVVDATNISLWGIGQPLHAFDADKIAGGHLIVRHARSGEKLLCLDGVNRELHPEDVVVADETRVLSLAGVIGGVESAISPGTTKNVLLEAAWWDPVAIRRTSRRHGLHTDASHRYERGADIKAIPEGLALAAGLILAAAGGELAPGTIDAYPRPFAARVVRLRHSRLIALSGLRNFPLERAAGILKRLGFEVDFGRDEIEAAAPSWRPDISIEEDLVEEVVRMHGYSKIPSALPPAERLASLYLSDAPEGDRAPRQIEDDVTDQAREAGLFESMNFPFVSASAGEWDVNLLSKANFRQEPLRVVNALDASRPALRRLLLPGLLEAASLNHRGGRGAIALFEVGRVWDRETKPGDDPVNTESRHFAAVLAGFAPEDFPVREVGILDLKGMIHRILRAVTAPQDWPDSVPLHSFRDRSSEVSELFEENSALRTLVKGSPVGLIGRPTRELQGSLALPASVVVAEIDLGALPRSRPQITYRDYSRFPSVEVDVTVEFRPQVTWQEIYDEIRGMNLANIETDFHGGHHFSFGGRYPDPKTGMIKWTVSLTFRANDRTLSQDEVNRERDRLLEHLKEKLGETK